MIRLRNARTGAVVVVPATTAARLGSHWERLDAPAPAPVKKPARAAKVAPVDE